MTVPTLPTAPTRTMAQDVFDPAMDAWIAALANWTTTVNAMGITTLTGSIQSTPIGNVTPSTGAFTTLSATATSNTAGTLNSPGGLPTSVTSTLLLLDNNTTYLANSGASISLGGNYTSSLSAPWGALHGYKNNGNSGDYGGGIGIYARANGTGLSKICDVSSTGLAVTGTIKGSTTIGVGNATPAASGAGITFPVTQSASSDANTLDDYEEGTWTPTIAGSTTAGTQTYSLQNGYYTKIGNKVFIEYFIVMTTKDAATAGDIILVGLPFTSAAGGGGVGRGDSWLGHSSLTLSANYYDAYLAMSSAGTIAYVSQAGSGQSFAYIPVSGLAGTSGFRGSFSYTV